MIRRRTTTTVLAAALAAVALAAAGCGGDDDAGAAADAGSASTPPAATAAATTPTVEPAPTSGTDEDVDGTSGTLTIEGGAKAGDYTSDLCFATEGGSLTMSANASDQEVSINVSSGTGTLLVANTANTELTNGDITALTVDGDGAFTGSGTYSEGTPFTISGACTGSG
ncbi:MAG TPA: hypothetical protein VL422_07795 [Miltoncostaea sp.]|nr:hypothetical protein [Miltoncostaea sp.]